MNDWRAYRPAIWLAMLGVALLLVLNALVGIVVVGAGIGVGLRIGVARRRRARAAAVTAPRRASLPCGRCPVTRRIRRRRSPPTS